MTTLHRAQPVPRCSCHATCQHRVLIHVSPAVFPCCCAVIEPNIPDVYAMPEASDYEFTLPRGLQAVPGGGASEVLSLKLLTLGGTPHLVWWANTRAKMAVTEGCSRWVGQPAGTNGVMVAPGY